MFNHNPMKFIANAGQLGLAVLAAVAICTKVDASGAVFTTTNATTGNSVVVFDRAEDGALSLKGWVPTGGLGTGASLGSASSLAFSDSGPWLIAVNSGSNDVSVFKVGGDHLTLTDREPSGGAAPISVTANASFVYVLNSGNPNNISGFRLTETGKLRPIKNSIQTLSGASVGPAQVGFTPNGDELVVTEKNTSLIDTYLVDGHGVASAPIVNPSSGTEPYGFTFDQQGHLYVTEAFEGAPNGSAISSYWIAPNGWAHVITASAPTGQTAACWVAINAANTELWTSNAASGSLSSFDISWDGGLDLDDYVAAFTGAGSSPTDISTTPNNRFVYLSTSGSQSILAFRVLPNGELALIGDFATGVAQAGLVAR